MHLDRLVDATERAQQLAIEEQALEVLGARREIGLELGRGARRLAVGGEIYRAL